jgi:hypothetical protein
MREATRDVFIVARDSAMLRNGAFPWRQTVGQADVSGGEREEQPFLGRSAGFYEYSS